MSNLDFLTCDCGRTDKMQIVRLERKGYDIQPDDQNPGRFFIRETSYSIEEGPVASVTCYCGKTLPLTPEQLELVEDAMSDEDTFMWGG